MKLLATYAIAVVIVVSCCVLAGAGFSTDAAATTSKQAARDAFCAALNHVRKAPAADLPGALDGFLRKQLDVSRQLDREQATAHRTHVLLGLATLFDAQETLANHLLTRNTFRGIARQEEFEMRQQVAHRIAFDGRNDAGLHFFLSIGLTASLGPFVAERVGRAKEIADAQRFDKDPAPGQQGYSFVDLAYDIAGVEYARRILEAEVAADGSWTKPVPIAEFVAPIATLELPERIGWKQFQRDYTGANHSRFEAILTKIRDAIQASVPAAPEAAETRPLDTNSH